MERLRANTKICECRPAEMKERWENEKKEKRIRIKNTLTELQS